MSHIIIALRTCNAWDPRIMDIINEGHGCVPAHWSNEPLQRNTTTNVQGEAAKSSIRYLPCNQHDGKDIHTLEEDFTSWCTGFYLPLEFTLKREKSDDQQSAIWWLQNIAVVTFYDAQILPNMQHIVSYPIRYFTFYMSNPFPSHFHDVSLPYLGIIGHI